ncbi:hypothetical protein [Mucilaginibacter sp.]|uniref:hypothetical protein n=1 Tax=Mucilaginibacter sp. TaxID=1882438 RepID=UPI003AFF99EC
MPEIHPFVSGLWNIHLSAQQSSWFNNGQSFGYIPNKDVNSIFLGSFPVFDVVHHNHVNGNLAFFYGVVGNRMWPVLSKISGCDLTNENEIFTLFNQSNFGITDVLKEVQRKGQSAADNALTPIIFNDIIDLLYTFPNITNIYVTSGGRGSVTSNHVHVSGRLREYFNNDDYQHTGFNAIGCKKEIRIYANQQPVKIFNLIALLSPSQTANVSIQGMINNKISLQQLIFNLPNQLLPIAETDKVRLLQWSYFLHSTGFIIRSELREFLNQHQVQLTDIFG